MARMPTRLSDTQTNKIKSLCIDHTALTRGNLKQKLHDPEKIIKLGKIYT